MSGISRAVFLDVKAAAEAAVVNEKATRQRVENLELWAGVFSSLSFRARMKWLFFGSGR